MRVAATSSDGKNVNEPFDLASEFFIYEINEKNNKVFIEKRSADRYSISLQSPRFKRNRFKKVYDAIKDCSSVYTNGISDVVARKLSEFGIEPRITASNSSSIPECFGI